MEKNRKNRRLLVILSIVVVVMFGFGYALVPLYDALCSALGINGKTGGATSASIDSANIQRTITVQFLATHNGNLTREFIFLPPKKMTIKIHPGENKRIAYFAENNSNHTITVQAIPSVTPGNAAKYLKKTECFCFNQQTLKPGEKMDMPLLFHLDRDLPKNIPMVTLSYTLFDVTGKNVNVSKKKAGKLVR